MKAHALRRPSAAAPGAEKPGTTPKPALPDLKAAMARLATLTAGAMPWFAQDFDLTPADGGPEVIGPSDDTMRTASRKRMAPPLTPTAAPAATTAPAPAKRARKTPHPTGARTGAQQRRRRKPRRPGAVRMSYRAFRGETGKMPQLPAPAPAAGPDPCRFVSTSRSSPTRNDDGGRNVPAAV
jgi:hypothetical protein